jgi:hypothetical protein
MNGLGHWRISEELSVLDAVALILGIDPSSMNLESGSASDRPPGWEAALKALKYAVLGKRIPAKIRRRAWSRGWDEEPGEAEEFTKKAGLFPDQDEFPDAARYEILRGIIFRADPDWSLTTVRVDDLREWLAGRGVTSEFFFPETANIPSAIDPGNPNFLDSDHPNFSPKLAAAVAAWQAVTGNPNLRRAKSVKTALGLWLRENAKKFRLTNKVGKVNEQALEESVKVANWDPKGGAPKTPGE